MKREEHMKAVALATWFRKKQGFFDRHGIANHCNVNTLHFADWINYFDEPFSSGRWPREWVDLHPVEAWAKEHGFRYADSPEVPLQVEIRTEEYHAKQPYFGTMLGQRLAAEVGRHIVENGYFEKVAEQTNPVTGEVVTRFRLTILKP